MSTKAAEVARATTEKTSARTKRGGRNARGAILDAAEELLQRRGYNAFSYHHIAVQLGIRNAAIHYHFPAKEDLGIELVSRFRLRLAEWIEALEERESDPWQLLNAYFEFYLDFLDEDRKICFSGMLGAEFQAIPDGMREETRQTMEQILHWLVSVLERGREAGRIQFSGPAEAKAVHLGASLQGGLQVARVAGPERFHQLIEQLRLELQPAS